MRLVLFFFLLFVVIAVCVRAQLCADVWCVLGWCIGTHTQNHTPKSTNKWRTRENMGGKTWKKMTRGIYLSIYMCMCLYVCGYRLLASSSCAIIFIYRILPESHHKSMSQISFRIVDRQRETCKTTDIIDTMEIYVCVRIFFDGLHLYVFEHLPCNINFASRFEYSWWNVNHATCNGIVKSIYCCCTHSRFGPHCSSNSDSCGYSGCCTKCIPYHYCAPPHSSDKCHQIPRQRCTRTAHMQIDK